MFNFLFTGIDSHLDKGFGITAEAYYKSAEHLQMNHFEHYDSTQQAEMPQNFLYRHSIELYLKSLIIIFHRELKINYGNVPFDSEDPEILSNGKWRKLYKCHYIDQLYYYWLNHLLLPNITLLEKLAPKGQWKEYDRVTELFPVICKYDQDSSFFRYPITNNKSLDKEKYTMQKIDSFNPDDFDKEINNKNSTSEKGSFTVLLVDEKDNIVDAYRQSENLLSNVRNALKEVADYFDGIHAMTRVTLCGGQ